MFTGITDFCWFIVSITGDQHSARGRALTPGVGPLTMNRTPVRDARDVPCVTAQPRLSPELSLESRNTSQLSILAGTPPTHPLTQQQQQQPGIMRA